MILVTGHKGFIGQRLFKDLQDKFGEENIIGYDLVDGDDLRDYFRLDKLFRENPINTIIHLAARAGVRTSEKFPDEYITTNIIGTNNILRCAKEYEIDKVIIFSSSSVYGSQTPPNAETEELSPESLYAVTKVSTEYLAKASPIKTIIVRPFTCYGENGRNDQVIDKWLWQINSGRPITFFGEGNTKRGYTYVGDLVDGVIKLIDYNQKDNHEVFNLGGQTITTLSELLDIFKKTIPFEFKVNKIDLPNGDVKENWADISKAKEKLGFNPDTNFKEKVKELIVNNLKK
ncbi:MAG: NAD-dependent epimerase/dehydratase family protein [Candidatus Pacebacteria bacterium]|nr:NAD-dependent epimerase/dehydratase family protein [Candidatus Paceibacterota bacterium]